MPIVVGALKDVLAPDCIALECPADPAPGTEAADKCGGGEIAYVPDACQENDEHGLRLTMFYTACWLFWAVFFFVGGWLLARRAGARRRKERDLRDEEAVHSPLMAE